MASIKKVYEDAARTTQIYPKTHEKAVIDDNGTPLNSKLGQITDLVNQKQMEIGAVPSDLTPTEGSTNWVTSGGIYNVMSDLLYTKTPISTSDGTEYQIIINTGVSPNVWEQSAGASYKGVLIPVQNGYTYVLEYSASQYTGVALIKNSTAVVGETIVYPTGEENHYDSPTTGGIKYIYEIEEDGCYLYVRNDTGSTSRKWPTTFYCYNRADKNILTKDELLELVAKNSSLPVKSDGIYDFVNGNCIESDGLSLSATALDLSTLTWSNKKPGGATDTKRAISNVVALPSGTKRVTAKVNSTGTYGWEVFIYTGSSYSEPYYSVIDWQGEQSTLSFGIPDSIGTGAYICIYAHRLDDADITTAEFAAVLQSVTFYTTTIRLLPVAKRKSIRFLFIGNSLTQDAVAWLPYVIKTGGVDIDYSFVNLYNGGYTLAQQWTGIQNGDTYEIASVCQNAIGWTNFNNAKTLDDILETYEFDILVLQEYFNYKESYVVGDLTPFNSIVDYVSKHSACTLEVVSLIHAPLRSRATEVYNLTVQGNQLILNNTCCTSLMNPGTAIYDALSTSLDSLGTQGHLSPDGTHAQEGLPCILEALNLLLWIYRKLGVASGVVNFQMMTDIGSIYSSLNIPGPNGSVIQASYSQQKLAAQVAAASFRKLAKIELGLE